MPAALLAAAATIGFNASPAQIDGWEKFNAIRAEHGLGQARLSKELCVAATGHVSWIVQNGTFSHSQKPNTPGYTGRFPMERMKKAGAKGRMFLEDIAMGRSEDAVQHLFEAPYHRKLFLVPGKADVGFGHAISPNPRNPDFTVIDLIAEPTRGVVASPPDGATDVPLTFDIPETPDPLRVHGDRTVGSAIMLLGYEHGEFRLKSATLNSSAGKVPVHVNHARNDSHMRDGVIVFPKDPLKEGKAYTARVVGTFADGTQVDRTWSFTTRS